MKTQQLVHSITKRKLPCIQIENQMDLGDTTQTEIFQNQWSECGYTYLSRVKKGKTGKFL